MHFTKEVKMGFEDDPDATMTSYFSKVDGGYIGSKDTVDMLTRYGIIPQRAKPTNKVCSIGYNHTEEKWYGWSHRAIYGFGVGSEVKKGDCAYTPTDWADFLDYSIRFWSDEYKINVTAVKSVDEEGIDCAAVSWTYSNDIPNEKLRSQISGVNMYPPEAWGKGEWTAKTLSEAKQMAIDFADGVS